MKIKFINEDVYTAVNIMLTASCKLHHVYCNVCQLYVLLTNRPENYHIYKANIMERKVINFNIRWVTFTLCKAL